MALSDRLLQNTPTPLPGNLNQVETDAVKGIPRSVFDSLTNEEKAKVLGINTTTDMPSSNFQNLSREEQMKIRGAELNQLQEESEPGSFSNMTDMIGRLMAAGVDRNQLIRVLGMISSGTPMGQQKLMKLIGEALASGLSREETSSGNLNKAEMEMLNNSAPINRFNTGGIVSLRRLTRPL